MDLTNAHAAYKAFCLIILSNPGTGSNCTNSIDKLVPASAFYLF
jgi:hypothetical protein